MAHPESAPCLIDWLFSGQAEDVDNVQNLEGFDVRFVKQRRAHRNSLSKGESGKLWVANGIC